MLNNFFINEVNIKCFAGVKDLHINFDRGLNIIYGDNRRGKTTLCAFIRYMFFGLGDNGEDFFPWEGEKCVSGSMRVVLDGEDYLIVRKTTEQEETATIATADGRIMNPREGIGEFITGLSAYHYDRTVYFAQKKTEIILDENPGEGKVSFKRLFRSMIKGPESTDGLDEILEQKNALSNDEKTGELDKLCEKRREYDTILLNAEKKRREYNEARRIAEQIDTSLIENDKKIVLLKAELESLNGIESSKRANKQEKIVSELEKLLLEREEIEKRITFDGRIPEEDEILYLSDISDKVKTARESFAEAEAKAEISRDNLAVHRKLMSSGMPDEEMLEDIEDSLRTNAAVKVVFIILTVLAFLGGAAIFALKFYFKLPGFASNDYVLYGAVTFALGLIFVLIASALHRKDEDILDRVDVNSKEEFQELREQLNSYAATEALYEDAHNNTMREYENRRVQFMQIYSVLLENLAFTGKPIVDEYEAMKYVKSLESDMEAYKEKGVEVAALREQMSINELRDDEEERSLREKYDAAGAECDRLTRENAYLIEKKDGCLKVMEDSKKSSQSILLIKSHIKRLERSISETQRRYSALALAADHLQGMLRGFESKFRDQLQEFINETLSFMLSDIESIIIDDDFELLYKRGDSIKPIEKAGGSLSALALLALRIAVITKLCTGQGTIIFDESFAYVDEKCLDHLLREITIRKKGQIIILTSAEGFGKEIGTPFTRQEI